MAQYSTNFSGYSPGSPPGDWTARWDTSNVTRTVTANAIGDGGNILRSTSTADARRMFSWDAVDADANRANVEVLARVRTSSVTSSDDGVRVHIRSSGALGAETSYFIRLPISSGTNWALNKYVGGVSTGIGSVVSYNFVENTLYNIRFRVNSTTLRARVWRDGEEEPSTWQVDTTDASIAAAGWVGVGRVDATPTVDFTHFIAATNGDTATWPAAVDTLARATQFGSEVASQVDPNLAATQVALEVMSANALNMTVTQVALETLTPQTQNMFATQVALEVLSGDPWPTANRNKYRQIQIAC